MLGVREGRQSQGSIFRQKKKTKEKTPLKNPQTPLFGLTHGPTLSGVGLHPIQKVHLALDRAAQFPLRGLDKRWTEYRSFDVHTCGRGCCLSACYV